MLFYSGSNSRAGGPSHVVLWRDGADGLEQLGSIELECPSWVAPHPRLPILYATDECELGAVVAVAVEHDGSLRERQRAASHGAFPCHLAIDERGTRLVVGNYQDGVVTVWRIAPDGTLEDPHRTWRLTGTGPVADRQEQAHPHMVGLWGDTVLVADLGADVFHQIALNGESHAQLAMAPGFGPRHFVTIEGNRAVLVGELSAELALIELGSQPRVLDVVPATRLSGAYPSGITARGSEVIVGNRTVGTIATFTVDGARLVPGAEMRVPGDRPQAISSDALRTFVCLQDVGLIAIYGAGDDDQPRLTRAPHVSDFGVIPWALGDQKQVAIASVTR